MSEPDSNQTVSGEFWDTFGLFEGLLSRFGEHLERARSVQALPFLDTPQTRIAFCGFSLFSLEETWGVEENTLIVERVAGELSLEELEWYEESAPAIQIFSCLVLGAMLGKFAAGTLDERGFLLGDAHLAGFLTLRNEEVYERFSAPVTAE